MWLFAKNGFVSVVAHREYPDLLIIRGRIPGDIESLFPGADVIETPSADYRFRAVMHHSKVAEYVASLVQEIDYPNFKDEVLVEDHRRLQPYSAIWFIMKSFSEGPAYEPKNPA